jgi:hypothetical protein
MLVTSRAATRHLTSFTARPRAILGDVLSRSSLIACALIVPLGWFASLSPSLGSSRASGENRIVHIADAGGDAILVVPETCAAGRCDLLVVSHRWGGKPEHALDRNGHPTYSAFLERFTNAGFALLLSNDGGLETWGNAAALENASRVWAKARALYSFGNTFTMGFSMGGLPATLLGLTGRLPVIGTVTVAAQLSLFDAYSSPNLPARSQSVARAYGFQPRVEMSAPALNHDPVGGLKLITASRSIRPDPPWRPIPTLAVASRADATVDFTSNSAAFVALLSRLELRTRLYEVTGGHLGADHFAPRVADAAIAFLKALSAHPRRATPIATRKP